MQFIFIILIITILSLIIGYIFTIKKIINQKKKINMLESENETISMMYDNVRVFKHDFFNFVQALDGYSENNDIEGVRKMNEEILKECDEINNMEMLNPKIINDAGVYSILTKKYCIAKKEGITIKFAIFIDISKSKISSYTLCKILSILLDNAIEAAKECDEKIINVIFKKDIKSNKELIIIENSYKKIDINLDKIFEKGYSTKENKKDHGLGLWNVRKILSKSENLNLFTSKDKLFSQQLEIYN